MKKKEKRNILFYLLILISSVFTSLNEILSFNISYSLGFVSILTCWIYFLLNDRKVIQFIAIVLALSTLGIIRFDFVFYFVLGFTIGREYYNFEIGIHFVNLVLLILFYRTNKTYLNSNFGFNDPTPEQIEQRKKDIAKKLKINTDYWERKFEQKSEHELKEILSNKDSFEEAAVNAAKRILDKRNLL